MRDKHEPDDAFVERLERQIAGEVRRRNRQAPVRGWAFRSPLRTAVVAAALVLVSMAIGGAVVAAAYQAKSNEQRDLLAANFAKRVELAKARLALASDLLATAQRKVSLGLAGNMELLDARAKVTEAQAQFKSLELQLEEVRLTGREPLNEISSPRVSGRDFVGERLLIDMSVPEDALQTEQKRLRDAQTRMEIGVADAIDVEVARARVVELEVAIEAFQRKIEIRHGFIKGELDAVQADLRALESEAQQRQKALVPRIELAKKEVQRTESKVARGLAQQVELAEVRLRLQQLEADMAKAELDLAVIRKRLGGRD